MPHVPSPRRSLEISHAAARSFVTALEADLARNSKRAIAALRRRRPDQYLRIAISLLPKDAQEHASERAATRADTDASDVPRRHYRRRVTADRLRELLDYAPETGRFRWRMRRGPVGKGGEAGHQTAQGYRVIGIDGLHYLAHRLAWLHVHGEHPPDEIDHINGDPTDDRIANLRPCSRIENTRNVRGGRTSRCKGVYRRDGPTPRFVAHIRVDGRQKYLGSFATAKQAWETYKEAAQRHYREFARVDGPADQAEANAEVVRKP